LLWVRKFLEISAISLLIECKKDIASRAHLENKAAHQPNRQGIISAWLAIISVLTVAMLIIPLGVLKGHIIFADITTIAL